MSMVWPGNDCSGIGRLLNLVRMNKFLTVSGMQPCKWPQLKSTKYNTFLAPTNEAQLTNTKLKYLELELCFLT